MRAYETLYVIKPDLDEEATTGVVDKYANLIAANGGEVVNINKWGKRKLAYEIEDYREGNYVLVDFKGQPAAAQELERVFKISDEILRYLIIRKEE